MLLMLVLSAATSATAGSLSDVKVAAAAAASSNTTSPPLWIVTMPELDKAAGLAKSSVPPVTVVPPVYLSGPERINSPPPVRVTLLPGLPSLIGPEMVNSLPVVAVTVKLLPRTTGTLIVWLPPLLPIEAAAVPLLSVNTLVVSPLLRLIV